MPLATNAGVSSAATIQAVQVSSYVNGPGQLIFIRHTAVAVAYTQNLKQQLTSLM